VKACWREIGIFGDSTCELLPQVIHCRNCVEYSRGGRELFDRPASAELLEQWTATIAAAKEQAQLNTISVVVFRLQEEWFALATDVFAEVSEYHPPHVVPFRTGGAFLGLVNVSGELLLTISLARLMGIPESAATPQRPRTCVITHSRERFAFPVDEVLGVLRVEDSSLKPAPSTVAKAKAALTESLFEWKTQNVGLLNVEKLSAALVGCMGR
jgi:chemotaxis-related protein WspD